MSQPEVKRSVYQYLKKNFLNKIDNVIMGLGPKNTYKNDKTLNGLPLKNKSELDLDGLETKLGLDKFSEVLSNKDLQEANRAAEAILYAIDKSLTRNYELEKNSNQHYKKTDFQKKNFSETPN